MTDNEASNFIKLFFKKVHLEKKVATDFSFVSIFNFSGNFLFLTVLNKKDSCFGTSFRRKKIETRMRGWLALNLSVCERERERGRKGREGER